MSSAEQRPLRKSPTSATFDDILEEIGGFGLYQKWIFLLTCYPMLLSGFFMLNPVFIMGVPRHRCAIPGYENDTYEIQSEQHRALINQTIPPSTVDGEQYDGCIVYKANISNSVSNWTYSWSKDQHKVECNKWVYDKSVFINTFVSQIDLVCDKKMWVTYAEMMFYGGMLVGSLASGILADRYGRKPVMYISILCMTGASIGLTWVQVYWLFCLLQIIIGAGIVGCFMPAYIISIEMTSTRKRVWPGLVSNYPYVVGVVILTMIAYSVRDWVRIELYTSLPGIIMISFWWLIPESPRWLLLKGRVNEAETVIRKAAKWNKVKLHEGTLFDSKSLEEEDANSSFLQMFSHKNLCVRTLLIFFNWWTVAIAYFGLALNSGNLNGDLYLNFGLFGIVEFPAYLIATFLVERAGRRCLFSVLMIIGGVSCIATVFPIMYAPEGYDVVTLMLALIGRLCVSAAFAVMYMHSVELLPTVVRNAGMGACSICARVGSIIAPYIVTWGEYIGGTTGQAFPLFIFGVMSFASGITTLWLPETVNMILPETIEDGEAFGR